MTHDLGLQAHLQSCGPSLTKNGDSAECHRCGATFSANRMIAAIASGQIRIDFSQAFSVREPR